MDPPPTTAGDGSVPALQHALLATLKHNGLLRSPHVAAAFHAVPRHLFLPGVPLDEVYRDGSVSIKQRDGVSISSSSQPSMMAIMLDQLDLQPGQRVLEIGTGTGYNAALMAQMVGATGHVVTIDLDADLVDHARAHLAAAGVAQVHVVCADGAGGYRDGAPYDRIIVTAAAWDIVPAWREQLRPGGRLVLPLDIRGYQESVAFVHHGDHLASVARHGCGFMPVRGRSAGPDTALPLGPEPGLVLTVADRSQLDAAATYHVLTGPRRDWPVGVHVSAQELGERVRLWLAARAPGVCSIGARGAITRRGVVPYLVGIHDQDGFSMGLVDRGALALLMRPPGELPPLDPAPHADTAPFALWVRSFGPDDRLAQPLIAHITAWNTAGRPGTDRLRLRVYPKPGDYTPTPQEAVIEKRWNWVVVDCT